MVPRGWTRYGGSIGWIAVSLPTMLLLCFTSCSVKQQPPALGATSRGEEEQRPRSRTADLFYDRCALGEMDSCTHLAQGHEEGGHGGFIPQDYGWALYFYKKACSGGHVDGCYRAGRIQDQGKTGTRREGLVFFEEACRRGHSDACKARVASGAEVSLRGRPAATPCERAWERSFRFSLAHSPALGGMLQAIDLNELCRVAPLSQKEIRCILGAGSAAEVYRCVGNVKKDKWYCFDIFSAKGKVVTRYSCDETLVGCVGAG